MDGTQRTSHLFPAESRAWLVTQQSTPKQPTLRGRTEDSIFVRTSASLFNSTLLRASPQPLSRPHRGGRAVGTCNQPCSLRSPRMRSWSSSAARTAKPREHAHHSTAVFLAWPIHPVFACAVSRCGTSSLNIPVCWLHGRYLDGLWYADLSGASPTWTDMTTVAVGDRPPGMLGHTATLVGTSMYVFGGITKDYGMHAAIYRYDTGTEAWSRIVASGAPPDGLYGHSSVLVNGQILIYGGSRNMPVVGQFTETIKSSYISSFNPVTDVFTPVMPLANCTDTRSDCLARRLHTATLVQNRYLLGQCTWSDFQVRRSTVG